MPQTPEVIQIFLSYASQDAERVGQLYQRLEQAGFKPWQDRRDILPGERWENSIRQALPASTFFLACLTPNAVSKRGWVQREIQFALEEWLGKLDDDIYLIPVRLEPCDLPDRLAPFQAVNLYDPNGWERLMQALRTGLERLGRSLPAARAELDQLLNVHGEYLRQLEVRAALQGLTPDALAEIERVKARIQTLRQAHQDYAKGASLLVNPSEWQAETQKVELTMRQFPDVQAAFENREVELRAIQSPFAKPFIVVNAPAGYGKTSLLHEIPLRLNVTAPNEWLCVRHKCHAEDTEGSILASLSQAIGGAATAPARTLVDLIRIVNHAFGNPTPCCLLIQFDEVEQWHANGQPAGAMDFIQQRFAPALEDAMRLSNRKFKVILAGRYIGGSSAAFASPSQEHALSPFDLIAIRAYVGETLRRFEQLQARQLNFTAPDVEYLAEQVFELTGGHPRAVANVMQDLVSFGFAVPLRQYFDPAAQAQLFDRCVADEIQGLFRGISRDLQEVFRILAIFRLFNGDTLQALLDRGYLPSAGMPDGWELHRQILRLHLAQESEVLSHDRILQRVLETQMRFLEPARYHDLQRFAEELYDFWLAGKDHRGGILGNGVPAGYEQAILMTESLYHTCRRLTPVDAPAQVLCAKAQNFVGHLRSFSGVERARRALRKQIEADVQMQILFKRNLTQSERNDLLDVIAS